MRYSAWLPAWGIRLTEFAGGASNPPGDSAKGGRSDAVATKIDMTVNVVAALS